jgi:hypothetical protein
MVYCSLLLLLLSVFLSLRLLLFLGDRQSLAKQDADHLIRILIEIPSIPAYRCTHKRYLFELRVIGILWSRIDFYSLIYLWRKISTRRKQKIKCLVSSLICVFDGKQMVTLLFLLRSTTAVAITSTITLSTHSLVFINLNVDFGHHSWCILWLVLCETHWHIHSLLVEKRQRMTL